MVEPTLPDGRGPDPASDWRADWQGKDAAGLTGAYATGLSHRLPLLYCVVICNSALLAANFLHSAPVWLLV
ncbi:hypothetical protein ABTN49_19915, partial [Acinetobacter baumannii]